MCYSNHHHRFRDKAIQQFDALFYEKGNLRRCHYRIWYDLAHRIWGISYKSYLSALRKDVSDVPDMPPQASEALKALIGSLLHNAPEWKRKRYVHRPGLFATVPRTFGADDDRLPAFSARRTGTFRFGRPESQNFCIFGE